MAKKVARYRWEETKATLDDIKPKNSHYSRVQALIKCGDELILDLDRQTDIIYRWHKKHTAMSQTIIQHIKDFPKPYEHLMQHGDILTWLTDLREIVVCDKQ